MKRIINPKTIQKALVKRQAAEQNAIQVASKMSDEEKDNIQATVLRELTMVCTNRIRLLEKVLGRKVSISTSAPMGTQIGVMDELSENPTIILDDERTFKIIVE